MHFVKPNSLKWFSPRAGRESPDQTTRSASSFFIAFFKRVQKKPAIFSVFIQLVSLILVLAFCQLLLHVSAFWSAGLSEIPLLAFVAMQAITASACAHFSGMATWWRPIHFMFPIALWGMLKFNVPNEVYLLGFLFTLSIFWSTYRTQVPYYPSRLDVWQRMSDFVTRFEDKHRRLPKVIDIGSGLGGLSLFLAKHHAEIKVEGIEIAPLPWLVSKLRSVFGRSSATFFLGDYERLNFADYDIVFAYLSPAAMPQLWAKARAEMRPGAQMISLEFEIPGVTPQLRLRQKGLDRELFLYQF